MIKDLWKPARLALLVGVCIGTAWVLGRAIAAPKAEKAQEQTYPLPEKVPLNGWELQASSPLDKIEELPPGREYQYRQRANSLTVQTRIMLSDGNISRLLFVYTPIKSANANLQIKHHPGVGYYGVLVHKGRAYLSACVNSRGESTVNEPQFMQNRYKYDLQITRVLPWILGQEPLLDQRCLWTLMFTPLPANAKADSTTTEETLKTLETAWFSWHRWWELHFPPVKL
ncbi:cyanoexosortase A system-associated protein [Leptothermofonsia sp. ETS-13]|uniref:cyanoexosortase A system-associated protein n=1 Tax=Leptothermofonsia sp. ETS-13 TaxID=3035696 RepID=UPI003BA3697F